MGTGEGVKGVTALLCLGGAAIPMAVSPGALSHEPLQKQRQVLSVVHQLFDDSGPLYRSQRQGGELPAAEDRDHARRADALQASRSAGLTNYIRDAGPPLLIVNSPSLDMWTEGRLEKVDPDIRLLPQDEEMLRATYAHYWDQIYLAGRQWSDLGAGERREFEIIVPGEHTLLAENPVEVDGRTYAPGATIALEAGPHELRTTAAEPDLRILWGKDLKLPSEDSLP
jgi:hypothetical protein